MKPSHRMLTGEISWALVALSFVWSGMGGWPLEASYLHRALDRLGETALWSAVLGVPAAVLFFASTREHFAFTHPPADPRKRWSLADLDRSARVRSVCSGLMCLSWLYIFKVVVELSVLRATPNGVFEGLRANAIMPIALAGAVCTFWFWWENRRVRRDVRKATGVFPAHPAR